MPETNKKFVLQMLDDKCLDFVGRVPEYDAFWVDMHINSVRPFYDIEEAIEYAKRCAIQPVRIVERTETVFAVYNGKA